MKRTLFSAVLVLLLSALIVPGAVAQIEQNPAYSSIQVLNLGATGADIHIYYYNQDGTLADMQDGFSNPVGDTVEVGESNTYFPVHTVDGFNGSVVIESTEEVAVISNVNYVSPGIQATWAGFREGGSSLRFPLIMKNNNNNDTTFNIQNTTGHEVAINIEFIPEPGAGYAAIMDVPDTIPAYSSKTYNQREMAAFADVTETWVGSARVTVEGEGAIAGVAQQIDSSRDMASAYAGFLTGASVVDLPLIMEKNNNMWTSINCQNLGPDSTDVTVEFIPEAGYDSIADAVQEDVAQNGTAVFLQYDYSGSRWVGAAKVSNSAGYEMACVVNQNNLVQRNLSAYEGFDGELATDISVAPLVQYQAQADGALWSSVNVKNLSETSTADITLSFRPEPGGSAVDDMVIENVAPGAPAVFLFFDPHGDGSNAVGGAEITADPAVPLAVVINQQKLDYTGDIYSSYRGFAR